MTKEQLRRIVKEEVSNLKRGSKKPNLKEGFAPGYLRKFKFEVDYDVQDNMDCDKSLPHAAYYGVGKDDNVQIWWWSISGNGKIEMQISNENGDFEFTKTFNDLGLAIDFIKEFTNFGPVRFQIGRTYFMV